MARSPGSDLGIPDDAARVLVLAESSHWPPSGTRGSKESYGRFVRPILDQILDALRADPKRVFSIESLFFLDPYWDERPERRGEIVEHMNAGQLRLSGGGITVPDTCLPDTESILRDFLLGRAWLESRGITQLPDVCHFPGNANLSPCLPELLRAAGFGAVAWSRLDGMYVRGADYRPATDFPLMGSNAARLLEQQSLDFVWRSGSSEVLAHWNAFLYAQGDQLAARWGLFGDRSASGVAARIDAEVARLRPLARTRFLFCPIGGDFHSPIQDLGALVARYDSERFPETGTWVVLGGLDDYFALLDTERAKLPVLELDPNPVWMGSLAGRGSLKGRCRRLTRALVAREAESARVASDHAQTWWRAVVTNHEGFIAGTSASRVVESEHEPWLGEAEKELGLTRDDGFPPAPARTGPSISAECTEGTLDRRQRGDRDPRRSGEGRIGHGRRSQRQSRDPRSPLVRGHGRPRTDGARAPRRELRARRSREHAPGERRGRHPTARVGTDRDWRHVRAAPRAPDARAPRRRRFGLDRRAGNDPPLAHGGGRSGSARARRARDGCAGRDRPSARVTRGRAYVLAGAANRDPGRRELSHLVRRWVGRRADRGRDPLGGAPERAARARRAACCPCPGTAPGHPTMRPLRCA